MASSNDLSHISNEFTLEFWVLPSADRNSTPQRTSGTDGTGGQRYAIYPEHGTGSSAGVGVSVGMNGISVFEHADSHMPSVLVYNQDIPDWSHVCVVYNDKTPHLYLNRQHVATGLKSTKEHVFPSRTIACNIYGRFSGLLDEICIYDRAITAEEIAQLHQSGSAGKKSLFR